MPRAFSRVHLTCFKLLLSSPSQDGHEATETLRAMGYEGVVIGLTGNATVEDLHAFMAHGADATCVKPVKVAELLEVLENAIGRPRAAPR
jgi:CheY-like chemotaxis protein